MGTSSRCKQQNLSSQQVIKALDESCMDVSVVHGMVQDQFYILHIKKKKVHSLSTLEIPYQQDEVAVIGLSFN